jgi:hypothetical protein
MDKRLVASQAELCFIESASKSTSSPRNYCDSPLKQTTTASFNILSGTSLTNIIGP